MAKVDVSSYQTMDDISGRLDEIVRSVRDKSVSLEHSLDLLDEAIALGSRAVQLVDTAEPSERERASSRSDEHGGQPAGGDGAR